MQHSNETGYAPFRVNFLIVGAQKSGTTALASFLGWHPEICIPQIKELHFFDKYFHDFNTDEDRDRAYHAEFKNYAGENLIGEATPSYLFFPQVAGRIHRYNPKMKLVGILRNPVERAISQHAMELSRGDETLQLPLALAAEKWRLFRYRVAENPTFAHRRFSYIHRGFYSHQIENLRRFFPKEQTLFLLSDDLSKHHHATLLQVQRFLGLTSPELVAPEARVFEAATKSPAPAWINRSLRLLFHREIDRLEKLLGRDLGHWRM